MPTPEQINQQLIDWERPLDTDRIPGKENILQKAYDANLDEQGQAHQKKLQFTPKAKKLLKKKLEADAKLEKELRKQEPVDLLEDEELATMPINVLGPR